MQPGQRASGEKARNGEGGQEPHPRKLAIRAKARGIPSEGDVVNFDLSWAMGPIDIPGEWEPR